MENEYLSIKEFATKVNVSTQSIYKMLHNKLQPYCKVINGVKHINSSAQGLFCNQGCNQSCTTVATSLQPNINVDKLVETFREQLAEKDKQIARLQEQQLALTNVLSGSQALHAGTIKEHIEEKPKRKTKSLFSWLFKH